MSKEKLTELSEMVTAIAEYLQKNGNPHQAVVITQESFKLVSIDYSSPVIDRIVEIAE